MINNGSVNEETLRGWIQEHKICWECLPIVELHHKQRVSVGLEMDLFAQHPQHATRGPGCSVCHEVFNKLREIALFVLPKDIRPSRYEIDPYWPSFHYRGESGWTPEVQLTIRVLHRQEYFEPIDDCETRCANEITSRLCALGAPKNVWSERSAHRGHSHHTEVAS